MNKQLKTSKISVHIQKVFLECVKFFDVFIQKKIQTRHLFLCKLHP